MAEQYREADSTARVLEERLTVERARVKQRLEQLVQEARALHVHADSGDFDAFLREPYVVLQVGAGEWRVAVPRFVDFHVGMLERSTTSYNVFRVNKFAKWLGNVPPDLEKLFPFKDPLAAVVQDGEVHVRSKSDQDRTWERYGKHLTRREGDTRLRIAPGAEFKLIAEMIDDGTLPFVPKPVQKEHLRAPMWRVTASARNAQGMLVASEWNRIELRDYQMRAYEEFLAKGAIGVYWPPSAGKTFISTYAIAHLTGPKLIVVPTSTLEEQWNERLTKYLQPPARAEVHVITYAGHDKMRRIMHRFGITKWRLLVFDECHVLPANTFSKFSTVPADYRMGLSATPYREDGRTDYIFALTGWPVGLDWNELIDLGIIVVPTITLSIVTDEPSKTTRLERLLQDKKRTLVFCDSIDRGSALARRLGCAFIDGSSSRRLDTIRRELETKRVVVCSRVADEGVSLQDLERVVEVDFLFGSRRQEGQRLGRLFHADEKGEHWILMTRDEHERYGKRLLAIREKGFRIRTEGGA